MKKYSEETIKKLVVMRKQGLSIPELMKKFDMPKTTIWHHVHNIKLDSNLLKRIRSRQGGSKERSRNAWETAKVDAKAILENKSHRDLAVAGAMLYWAEGNKKAFVFTNTDPDMLKLFIDFTQICLSIPKSEHRLLIRIATPIVPAVALNYWSSQLGVSEENIKLDWNDKNNKTKTEFGICRVWIKKSGYHFKVLQCMIDSLKQLS